MMVDLMATSAKLRARKRVVMTVTGADYDRAAAMLKQAGIGQDGHRDDPGRGRAGEAAERLARAGGFVRKAIEAGEPEPPGKG
jgi:N-acetylmuramic acid 6-phosphate (MurNAc-6-P) etherase